MRGQAGPAAPRQRWQHCPMALPHVPAPAPAAQQAGPLARPGSRARRLVGGGVATLAVLWLHLALLKAVAPAGRPIGPGLDHAMPAAGPPRARPVLLAKAPADAPAPAWATALAAGPPRPIPARTVLAPTAPVGPAALVVPGAPTGQFGPTILAPPAQGSSEASRLRPSGVDSPLPPAEAEEGGAGDPPPLYATRLPGPAQLRYALSYNGQAGEATLTWRHDGERYSLVLDGAGVVRPLVVQSSEGGFDAAGLAPERFVDRRRGARQQAANFLRDRGRIGFSGVAADQPAWPGAQDRLSWLAQLAAIRAAGEGGAEIRLFVVDARGHAGSWRLQRQADEPVASPSGLVQAEVWRRDPPRPDGLRVEAWLDPGLGHWPVVLRFTAPRSGDVFALHLLASPQRPAPAAPTAAASAP